LSRSSAHIYLGKLSQIVADAIRVPKNPVLVHFLFESICVIIRKVKNFFGKEILKVYLRLMSKLKGVWINILFQWLSQ